MSENKCKDRCRQIVMSGLKCESCEEIGGEQHHGLFKSSQRIKLNPALLFDPALQFNLCPDCHKHNPDAPHVDNDAFLSKMAGKGGKRAIKALNIYQACQGPLVMVAARDVDYGAILDNLNSGKEMVA